MNSNFIETTTINPDFIICKHSMLPCFLFALMYAPILMLFTFSTTCMFFIYVHVSRRNRERDKETSIYHITRHFYLVVQFMQISFFLGISIIFAVILYFNDSNATFKICAVVLIPLTYFVFLTVTMIEHILLSLLAIQRCFIFFFDWSLRYVTVSDRTWSILIRLLYFLIFVFNCTSTLSRFLKTPEGVSYGRGYDEFVERLNVLNTRFYFLINLLMIISALFYIPMLVKIKKLSKLQSVKKNQPERYVVYQTILLLVFKLLYIPSVLLLSAAFSRLDEDIIFFGMISIDIFTTHFIIQCSYLICSQHNLASTLVCCGFSRYAEVEPVTVEMTTNNE
ncbi:unnamed protein product [Caenorhabditis brenneri]